jgi:hypothetical protein
MPANRTRPGDNITDPAARAGPDVLAGLLVDTASATVADSVNGQAAYCPRGCGYRTTNCGCPGSPRLNGRGVVTVQLPEPEPVGCPRCRPDGCKGCGYRPARCTCPGGPRAQL